MNKSLDIYTESRKQENNSSRKKQRKMMLSENPEWGIIWRVLLVCAMIDMPIWAYFNFVKNISMWEGLQQARTEIQRKMNPPKADNKQANYLKIEAEKARREFLERQLEILKQKTIAAEMQKWEK